MFFNSDAISSFVGLPFIALHVSMIVFLCRQRRIDETFRNTFFTLYVIVSIADVAVMCAVRSQNMVFLTDLTIGLYFASTMPNQ